MATASNFKSNVRIASGLNVLIGVWLIAAPWILGYGVNAAIWNDVIVGVALLVLAGIRVAMPGRYASISWVNVVLGVWLFLAPFILQYGSLALVGVSSAIWNDVILGIAVIVLGWLSAANTTKLLEQ
ncbi:SPW repeat protein [Proteobacteria bacterium 005FR1]|nr:SPW repeat protein [Proteobacteria bacterium 005FR1]